MNNGSRLALPGQPMPQPVVHQIASPINDIQIVCLVAAHLPGTAADRVFEAQDIVAEAVANGGRLSERIGEIVRAKQAAVAESAQPSPNGSESQ